MRQRAAATVLGLAAVGCGLPEDGSVGALLVAQTEGNMCEGFGPLPSPGWGQSFAAPRSAELTRVALKVHDLGHPFSIAVYQGDGFAGAQLLTMNTVVNFDADPDQYFGMYHLSDRVPLVAGQVYTIGVNHDTNLPDVFCSASGDPYPGGTMYAHAIPVPSADATFAVYGDP